MALPQIYQKLLKHFGRQHWWSENTPVEVVIGTILTQHTAWKNAWKAISNLKKASRLKIRVLAQATPEDIQELIYAAGLYRQKAKRIINLSSYILCNYQGDLRNFFNKPIQQIREEMLSLDGIGKETADSILLYAANKLIFPVDEYTIRFCKRYSFLNKNCRYEDLRAFFESKLPEDLEIYKEFRALMVKLGKVYCKKNNPKCDLCPLIECEFKKRQLRN